MCDVILCLNECHSLVRCMNVLFEKLMGLCYEILFTMHQVMVSTLLAI